MKLYDKSKTLTLLVRNDGARREDPDADFQKTTEVYLQKHKARTKGTAEPDYQKTKLWQK